MMNSRIKDITSCLFKYIIIIQLFCIPQISTAEEESDKINLKAINTLYQHYQPKFPEVLEISIKEAIPLITDKNVVFIDTRSKKEVKISSIPGSISLKDFKRNKSEYKNKQIIAFCTIGFRSGKFAEKYQKQGFHIMNLKTGLLGWVHSEGPITNQMAPTRKLHVYSKKWNLVPESYTAVW